MSEFRGVFPAVATPMTPGGKLNEAAFRQMIEFNIEAGVDGFWVAGGSGESVLLDDEENNRVARRWYPIRIKAESRTSCTLGRLPPSELPRWLNMQPAPV